jgi:aryl-alcohol dehydrogenase-like predicted oxidoreductase
MAGFNRNNGSAKRDRLNIRPRHDCLNGERAKSMETIRIGTSGITASRIALSARAIGGWLWGENTIDLEHSIATIHRAIDRGITLIDTAPVYGFGLSERIVGTVLSGGLRGRAIIATKAGLEWRDGKVRRNSSPAHLRKEVEESLRRLRTDHIDLYQLHWPDPQVPIQDTAQAMARLLKDGKIRAIGVCRYSPAQMDEFRQAAPIHAMQLPYNLFERQVEAEALPYASRHNITVLCHDTLCRGLLRGMMTAATRFSGNDLRRSDAKFREPRFSQYLSVVASLNRYARACYGAEAIALAVRWVLDQGNTIALWNALYPEQLEPVNTVMGWELDEKAKRYVEKIARHALTDRIASQLTSAPSRGTPALMA